MSVDIAVQTMDKTAPSDSLEESLSLGPARAHFVFRDRRGNADRPIKVHYSRPDNFSPSSPIIFVLPGMQRSASPYISMWAPHTDRVGALLLVPEFSRKRYPGSAHYNLGNMFSKEGVPNPRAQWSFMAIEHLFDAVRQATGSVRPGYRIFGHSAGGQFVERMALFVPDTRIELAISANAGWHTAPRYEEVFPYGLRDTMLSSDDLQKALAVNLHVLVGENDNDPDHPSLRRSARAMGQGRHRLERAAYFVSTAHDTAALESTTSRWRLHICPGVGHSHQQIFPCAAKILLSEDTDEFLRSQYSARRTGSPDGTGSDRPMKHFDRIFKDFDKASIVKEVMGQPEMWLWDTSRQKKLKVQSESNAIPIRALDSSAINGRDRRDVHESKYTPIASHFPETIAFLESFARSQNAQLGRARIVRLGPGKRVFRHIDRGEYYRVRDRYHLVLMSNGGSYLAAGDEHVSMREGELWRFDNKQPHEAANESNQDRIHLIFDLLPNSAGESQLRLVVS